MTITDPKSADADELVRRAVLAARCVLYAWLVYVLVQAVTAFSSYTPGTPWPFLLSMIRMWTFLPIHEAGHLIFMPLGTVMMFLGGSILQILLPAAWFALAFGQRSSVWPFPLFWAGENIMDVSLYLRDAPVRALPLLGGHKSGHDWFNILSRWDLLDAAEPIADVLFLCGTLVCIGAIAAGFALAIRSYRSPEPATMPE
jgi:hypothetical protein